MGGPGIDPDAPSREGWRVFFSPFLAPDHPWQNHLVVGADAAGILVGRAGKRLQAVPQAVQVHHLVFAAK